MMALSPRSAFWIGLVIASLSAQMNAFALLWTWSAVARLSTQRFADTHYLLVRVAGLAVHLGIYLAVLAAVRKIVAPRSPRTDSVVVLVSSLSYSGIVIGLMVYLMALGGLP